MFFQNPGHLTAHFGKYMCWDDLNRLEMWIELRRDMGEVKWEFKDGAYYCNCAYILRISRYSGFLWVVPTNTGIFFRSLNLCGESRTYQMLLVSQMKIGGNHAFFRDN